MKKYRALVPVVLIAAMILSWYVLVSESMKVETAYSEYLDEARQSAQVGRIRNAIENYKAAINVRSTPEIYVEVAEFYKAQKDKSRYLEWCKDFFEEYPTNALSYDCLLTAYYEEQDYKSCFDVLNTANKRKISSDLMTKISTEIAYMYDMDFYTYTDVGIYSNNYCAVKSKEVWGFVDRYGKQRVSPKYSETGAFSGSNLAPVVYKNKAYFIDKSGELVIEAKEKYQSFGLMVDGRIASKKENGRYEYINDNLKVIFGDYDYASAFNYGIAAVRNENRWQLINSEGKPLLEEKYLDIKIDEKQIACRNDRIFVSKDLGKYIMIDTKGKQIGNLVFEDAKVFAGNGPTAVKMNGKWQFMDNKGKLISDRTYGDARPYANGLAAVCMDDKWGFVDEEENLVINAEFFDAKDFNEKGSCFVKIEDTWQLLKLYRLNRED